MTKMFKAINRWFQERARKNETRRLETECHTADAGFLSALSQKDRIQVSNVNPLILQFILKKKNGEDAPVMVGDEATFALLRKLSAGEIHKLKESVEYGQKGDAAAGSSMSQAASMYKKAIEANPYNSLALLSHGVAVANLGNLREGIKWVEKALQVDPENERIRNNLKGMKADL